jgi:hypothetical protein
MVALAYQAISPKSSFYTHLQHDRAFRVLSKPLFTAGSLFHIFQHDLTDFNQTIEREISKHPEVFCGNDVETSLIIGDFREALQITCRDYPEIVYVTAFLEQSHEEIIEMLTDELSKRKFEDVDDIVDTLFYGDGCLGERVSPDEESFVLYLISREAVTKGASILRQIEPEMLFPGGDEDEEWYSEEFRAWKDFYLSADDLGAEIIMDVI